MGRGASLWQGARWRALVQGVPPALATAVAISIASHLAVYSLTPVLSLHMVALGGTGTQVGLAFSMFALVAVVLRPAAGAWIDRRGVCQALFPGAALMVLGSLGLQVAAGPPALIAAMPVFGVGYGLTTMAAAVLAASAPAEQRGRALSIYYLAAPVSMAVAAPLGLWLFHNVGARADFAMVTALGLAAAGLGLAGSAGIARRPSAEPGPRPLWSPGAVPLSLVLVVAAMGQSALYAFLPLHAAAHGQERNLVWFFGLYSACMVAFRAAVSVRADRWGGIHVLAPALGFLTLGLGLLIPPPIPLRLAASALLLAAGSSALYPMLVALVVERVPSRERGVAMGTVSGAWDLGVVAGSLSIGTVVEHASHGAGFALAAACTFLALAGLVLVERRRTRARLA